MKRENMLVSIFGMLFLASVMMIGLGSSGLTGFATSGSTVSNVTIVQYLSISMSDSLSSGILYGSVDTLPAGYVNASHNYDGTSSGSSMFINVSTDSNTPVDFCIDANSALYDSSGGNVLGLGNETYSNSTSNGATDPAITTNVSLTTSYVKAGTNVAKGNSNYYRVWLSIPAAQPAGTYNNSINFKGVVTGQVCGS